MSAVRTNPDKKRKVAGKEKPPASSDPIFKAIEAHSRAMKEWLRIDGKLDNRKHAAMKRIGRRPFELIAWRNNHIGGTELAARRDEFIAHKVADRKTIEAEYRDAVRRYERQVRRAAAWDRRAGIAKLRGESEAANEGEQYAAQQLARTYPTTIAGVAALLTYAIDDSMDEMFSEWGKKTLSNATGALRSMASRYVPEPPRRRKRA
jgi:hypothetical protein